jgi:(E)-4-hydroxy-3-methylbut-2-enyl-diphosphate synthase
MKASNVKVMVQANRLLVKRMIQLGMDYPIHLGVTEAGDAEDGRIKSAAGIGPLLADGIGDTIRVSLTEDPEREIPVARRIIDSVPPGAQEVNNLLEGRYGFDPCQYERRQTHEVQGIGAGKPPAVVIRMNGNPPGTPFREDFKPDLIAVTAHELQAPGKNSRARPVLKPLFIRNEQELHGSLARIGRELLLVFDPGPGTGTMATRDWFRILAEHKITNPVIVRMDYGPLLEEELMIRSTIDFAALLVDGLPDGIWIGSSVTTPSKLAELAFGILQATGERISKTEYIACPACGRTLFDIQATLQQIKERTSHLKGLKIGVMGCCVNGPGEMADAHYGYVGGARGKITLYKGKKIMKAGIPQEQALDELVRLIKEHGDWK